MTDTEPTGVEVTPEAETEGDDPNLVSPSEHVDVDVEEVTD